MFKIKLKDKIYRKVYDEKLNKVLKEKKVCCDDVHCCEGGYVYCQGCVFDDKDAIDTLTFEELGIILSPQEIEINGVISSDILSQQEIMDLFLDFCEKNHMDFGGNLNKINLYL